MKRNNYYVRREHYFILIRQFLLTITFVVSFLFTLLFSSTSIYGTNPTDEPMRHPPELRTNSPVFAGNELTLIALGGTSAYWYGPNGYTSTLAINTLNNTDSTYTGTYYCEITDSILDTVYYLSVNVQILPAPRAGLINTKFDTIICRYATLGLIATPGLGPYSWYDPNGNLIATTALNNIDIPCVTLPGNYCVHCGPGGTTQGCIHISVVECCADPCEDILLLDNKHTLQCPTPLPVKIAVKDYLIIDNPSFYSFPGCQDITMLPQAVIGNMMGTASSITMDHINIHGCQEEWDMLQITDMFQSLKFDLNKCTISDCNFGVIVVSWSFFNGNIVNFNCNGNTFNNNNYGLIIGGFTLTDPLIFTSNNFLSTSPYQITPNSGKKGEVGLELDVNELVFPNYPYSTNYFSDLRCGIYSVGSSLDFEKGTVQFDRIFPQTGIGTPTPHEGYSMYLSNDVGAIPPPYVIKVGVNGTPGLYDFNDCATGIYAKGYDIDIRNNKLVGVNSGLFVTNCQGKSINVENNDITCDYSVLHPGTTYARGIFFNLNDPLFTSNVANNIINILPCGAVAGGMFQSGSNVPSTSGDFIYNNKVTLNSSNVSSSFKFGYYGSTNAGVSLGGFNEFNLNNTLGYSVGVYMANSDNDSVWFNVVRGPGFNVGNTAALYPKGLESVSTINSIYECNNFNDLVNGMSFEGPCLGTDQQIKGNVINNYWLGLHYNATANTGSQNYRGNQWQGTNGFYGAVNYNQLFPNSLYIVHTPPAGYLPTTPIVNPNNTGWFNTGPLANYECPNIVPPGGSKPLSSTVITHNDSLIALNSITYPNYNQELRWISSRFLFSKLAGNPSLLGTNSLMSNFYSNIAGSSAAKFEKVSRARKVAMTIDPILANSINAIQSLQMSFADSIAEIDSLLHTGLNLADSIQLTLVREMIVQAYYTQGHSLDSLVKIVEAAKAVKVNNVISQNLLLPANTIYEQNEKVITDIYLNTIAKGKVEFNSSQLAEIYIIASQCPLAGGPAVYFARSLYLPYGIISANDDSLCMSQVIQPEFNRGIINTLATTNFKYFPNPTRDQLTLTWDNSTPEISTVQFRNSLGIIILEKEVSLNTGFENINTSSLSSGAYFMTIKSNNGTKEIGKLIIVK